MEEVHGKALGNDVAHVAWPSSFCIVNNIGQANNTQQKLSLGVSFTQQEIE